MESWPVSRLKATTSLACGKNHCTTISCGALMRVRSVSRGDPVYQNYAVAWTSTAPKIALNGVSIRFQQPVRPTALRSGDSVATGFRPLQSLGPLDSKGH